MEAFFQHKNKSRLNPVRGFDYPAHLHRAVEFGYLEEGECILSVDGKDFPLREGDVFIIFPDRVHLFEKSKNVRGYLAFALTEEFPLFAQIFTELFPASPVIEKERLENLGIGDLFRQAVSDPHLENKGVVHGYVSLMLGKLLPLLPRGTQKSPRQEELYRVLSYLGSNFRENLSRKSIAREMGISESSLSHLFSASLRISLPRYLTLLRLEEAQHLLTQSRLSVTAVASAAGFPSLRTMNRAFVSELGKSPTNYRNEHKEDFYET